MATEIECEVVKCKWNDDNGCIKDKIVLFDSNDIWDECKPALVCEDYEEE